MEQEKQLTSLPENAYRELAPGEEYTPMLPASAAPAEVTPYSVGMGIVMAVVFSAAAAYLGLKIGQVFEAAIPIAIIAVGMGSVLGKRNMLGQNVIIQSIGASSGVIVAGAIFTLPALYILGLDAAFYQIFLSSLFGGLLGIVLLIPFRSYFVKEMHGKYPFPEATATTEVLVSGEKGGAQAKLLAVAGAVGGCQAEVGIASAMAASAAVELMGGNPQQCLDAASTVLMNMLGLVCDPVGGLVEYPCQNRNAAGVANALIAAELSLSGIRQLIPFDQMLDAMYAVGKRLPAELRETALGGCAATPAACAACGLCSGN